MTLEPLYMGWQDSRPGATPERRIADAVRRFERKHGQLPAVALVNADEVAAHSDVAVEVADYIQPSYVHVGPVPAA